MGIARALVGSINKALGLYLFASWVSCENAILLGRPPNFRDALLNYALDNRGIIEDEMRRF